MPFSLQRTELIQRRIIERLESGLSNEWELSLLTNMAERFDRNGTKTRLSEAQYGKLQKILKLDDEKATISSETRSSFNIVAPTHRATKHYRGQARTMSVTRALTAPRRAVRRVQRQLFLLIMAVMGFMAFIGMLFDTGTTVPRNSPPQVNNTASAYVTGSRVNQREGPSTATGVMGVLVEGVRVQAVDRQGDWTQITSSFGTGWMASKFLSSTGPPIAQVTPQGRMLRASDVRVIDGDTVDISGQAANVRLVGFNTPETWRPSCSKELEVARRATARLTDLVRKAQSIEFRHVACLCRKGTEGTDQCNFGRQCGSLIVNGIDVGKTLIQESLAVPYRCSATSCPRRPQVWCQ
jgi:endonuclease YncB( thermonuclease family)